MTDDDRTPRRDTGRPDDVGNESASAELGETLSAGVLGEATVDTPTATAAEQRRLPEWIGGCRVIGVLGEGGMGTVHEAERSLIQALDTRRHVLGDDHYETLVSIDTMGFWYFRQGRHDESEALVREALERGRRVLGADHPEVLVWDSNPGQLLQLRGRLAEAEPCGREVVESGRRAMGPAHPGTLRALRDLAALVARLGRPDEAEALLLEGLAAARGEHGAAGGETVATRSQLADLYLAHGREADARPVVAEQLDALRAAAHAADEAAPKNEFAWQALTCEPADLRDPAAALGLALEAAELDGWRDPDILRTLALAHHRTGNHVEGVTVVSRALDQVPADGTTRREPLENALARYRAALPDQR